MKLKNKIFFCFFLLVLFILFFNINNVFANYEVTCNDTNYSIPETETLTYYVIVKDSENNKKFLLHTCSDPIIIVDGSNGNYKYKGSAGYDSYIHTYQITYNNGSWSNWSDIGNVSNTRTCYVNNFLYTSHDLYYNNEVFFQAPVQEETLVIPALETAEQIPEAMGTTLRVVIPVGLVVLGIGLVIYLIKRVIYTVH